MGIPLLRDEAQDPDVPPHDRDLLGRAADVLDALTAQVAVIDGSGTIVAANAAWRRFASENGATDPGRVGVGVNYLDVCREADGPDAAAAHAAMRGIVGVLEGRLPTFTLEYPCHSPAEQRWFLLQVTPLPPAGSGAVVTHINITERVRAELDLLQAKMDLEHAVMERTRDLQDLTERLREDITQRRETEAKLTHYTGLLQQQTARLERSNDDLRQFAHVVSHELHEPLRMVASFLTLLRQRYRDQLDDTAREFIEYAVDGSTRMQRLISSLLMYAKVDEHGERLGAVNGEAALAAALAALHVNIEETGATITSGPLPTVRGSSVLISQLFQNLIANAIKFRSAAAPVVRVSAERRGEWWAFSVCDNGIGVAAQDAERIFRMFERGQSRSTYAGSGIGLAVCRRIVAIHGGAIWVEPAPGGGAAFWFTLPAAPASE